MAKATKAKADNQEETLENSETVKDHNRDYEEWPVTVTYDEDKKPSFKKAAQEPTRVTRITPDRAAEINSQSENTKIRLYEIA